MNYLLLVQLLIILVFGMKIGLQLYKKEFDFTFYTDIICVVLWIYVVMKLN